LGRKELPGRTEKKKGSRPFHPENKNWSSEEGEGSNGLLGGKRGRGSNLAIQGHCGEVSSLMAALLKVRLQEDMVGLSRFLTGRHSGGWGGGDIGDKKRQEEFQ